MVWKTINRWNVDQVGELYGSDVEDEYEGEDTELAQPFPDF